MVIINLRVYKSKQIIYALKSNKLKEFTNVIINPHCTQTTTEYVSKDLKKKKKRLGLDNVYKG